MKILRNPSLIALAFTLSAVPSFAAESGEGKAGLPQLDPSLFPAQLFWLALTFAALYLLMAYVALPGVKRTLDRRSHVLEGDLQAAEEANNAAKAMIAQYEKALADARSKAQATVNEITATAAKQATDEQTAQHKELNKRLTQAEGKVTAARDEAVRNLKSSATELAAHVVEKVSGLKGVVHG